MAVSVDSPGKDQHSLSIDDPFGMAQVLPDGSDFSFADTDFRLKGLHGGVNHPVLNQKIIFVHFPDPSFAIFIPVPSIVNRASQSDDPVLRGLFGSIPVPGPGSGHRRRLLACGELPF